MAQGSGGVRTGQSTVLVVAEVALRWV